MYRVILSSLLLTGGLPALASTSIIPSLTKIKRERHITPIATAWSQRNMVGMDFEMVSSKDQSNGVDDLESRTTEFMPYVFYSNPMGFTAEFGFNMSSGEDEYLSPPAPADDITGTGYEAKVGFKIPQSPAVFGLGIGKDETKSKDGTSGLTSKSTEDSLDLGVGYQLPSKIYLGFNLNQMTNKATGIESETDHTYTLGAGYVEGDFAKPAWAGEILLNYLNEDNSKRYLLSGNGLMNVGAVELRGLLGYAHQAGNVDGRLFLLQGAVDYDIGQFYIAPGVVLVKGNYEQDLSNVEQDFSQVRPSLELGMRMPQWTAYIGYNTSKSEYDLSGAMTSSDETNQSTLMAGGHYSF